MTSSDSVSDAGHTSGYTPSATPLDPLAQQPAGVVRLRNAAGDTAMVSLYGAQVLSWCTAAGGEQLYCSPHLTSAAGLAEVASQGRALRGGVPVCFPQFSDRGPLPKHGLVRTQVWRLTDAPHPAGTGDTNNAVSARFTFTDSEATRAVWPHPFALALQVVLGTSTLELRLQVTNTGASALAFTAALHTYLAVPDIRHTRLVGLAGTTYADALAHLTTAVQGNAALHIEDELDRVYLDTPAELTLNATALTRLHIAQQGFTDTVVWNPGPAKAATLGDMPAADWTRMLCIEAAAVQHPVQLPPGAIWQGSQRFEVQQTADNGL